MKRFLIAALFALISLPAFADGVSCPEMAKMIADYEHEKKAGGISKLRVQTVNSVLSATRQSYASAGCNKQNSNAIRK